MHKSTLKNVHYPQIASLSRHKQRVFDQLLGQDRRRKNRQRSSHSHIRVSEFTFCVIPDLSCRHHRHAVDDDGEVEQPTSSHSLE